MSGALIKCRYCGADFHPRSKRSLYCSEQCRRKAETDKQDTAYISGRLKGMRSFLPRLRELYADACAVCGFTTKFGISAEKKPLILEMHHIKPVSEGGESSLENMILLCPTCHRKAHAGLISREELYEHQRTEEDIETRRNEDIDCSLNASFLAGCEYDYTEQVDAIARHYGVSSELLDRQICLSIAMQAWYCAMDDIVGRRKTCSIGHELDSIGTKILKTLNSGEKVKHFSLEKIMGSIRQMIDANALEMENNE